jgi:hypothetical protein
LRAQTAVRAGELHALRWHHLDFAKGGSILALVDDKAQPVTTDELIAPLPLRFRPHDDESLAGCVERLNEEEQRNAARSMPLQDQQKILGDRYRAKVLGRSHSRLS